MYESVYAVTNALRLVSPDDFGSVEVDLNLQFPPGYREFLTQFGEGSLNRYIYVFPPSRVRQETEAFRETLNDPSSDWKDFSFWSVASEQLRRDILQVTVIATTFTGMVVISSNGDGELRYVPRFRPQIECIGHTILQAFDWLCSCDEHDAPMMYRVFEPLDCTRGFFRFDGSDAIDFESVRAALVDLGFHDFVIDEVHDDGPDFRLFVKEFGGYVNLFKLPNDLDEKPTITTASIRCDAGVQCASLDRIVCLLTSFGFQESSNA